MLRDVVYVDRFNMLSREDSIPSGLSDPRDQHGDCATGSGGLRLGASWNLSSLLPVTLKVFKSSFNLSTEYFLRDRKIFYKLIYIKIFNTVCTYNTF